MKFKIERSEILNCKKYRINQPKNPIYCIDLNNFVLCHNLVKTNEIITASLVHRSIYKTKYPLYEINPDRLLKDVYSRSIGVISPRFSCIIKSSSITNGSNIVMGVKERKPFSFTEKESIHRIAKFEIEFEKVRIQVDSNLPSRLDCIFVAEDSLDGRMMLGKMFSGKKNICVVPVVLKPVKIHKADAGWMDMYEKDGKISSIEKYWKGAICNNSPQWEYLLEGSVGLKNKSDRRDIELKMVKV